MDHFIRLFMWGYQHIFHISIQNSAEVLFNSIDPRLKPSVFLLGFLSESRNDRNPICIQPEDCKYSTTEFEDVMKLAEELEKVDHEKNILQSNPIAQEYQDRRISNNALIEAIKKILNKSDFYGDTTKFVSYPTYVEGYLVFVVLEIQSDALKSYYSLTKYRTDERYKISRSFVESAAITYLKECSNALKDPNKAVLAIERQSDEILRESGRHFMNSISQAGKSYYGMYGLYDACNSIASMRYEGAEGLGKVIIAERDHRNIRMTLQLQEPIKVNDYRKVRKFLELSDDKANIISNSEFIYGLGEQTGIYNPNDESLFIINFISHYKWEVMHNNNTMMVVEYKQPNLPKERIDKEKFYDTLFRIFKQIDKFKVDHLWEIFLEATKQKHGTILVLTDNAKDETTRLGKQCFSLKPLKLTSNIVQRITSIDGAVILDTDSVCYAIGVILDGVATDKGDASRGARFNSAVRYYEHFGKNHSTVIIIISEDGMINIIPDLRPQINHSTIIETIDKLKKFSISDKNKPYEQERKQFNQLMAFFDEFSFYLTQEECNIINQLRKSVEEEDKIFDGIKMVRRDLIPNKEMNESYYFT